jgi:hypothetical protein
MSEPPDLSGPAGNGQETADEREMAHRLQSAAPVPAAAFRGALGRYLRGQDPGYGPRPPQLRLMSAACVGGGAVLLLVAGLQATGSI